MPPSLASTGCGLARERSLSCCGDGSLRLRFGSRHSLARLPRFSHAGLPPHGRGRACKSRARRPGPRAPRWRLARFSYAGLPPRGRGRACKSRARRRWTARASLALAAALLHWLARTGKRARALARVLWRRSVYGAGIVSAWTATASRTLAVNFRQRFSAASQWTAVNGRHLARSSVRGARRASSWGAARSQAAAVSLGRNVSSGAAWSAAQSQAAAVSLRRNVSSGAAWSAAKAKAAVHASKAAVHASIAASRMSYSWAALRMRHVSNMAFPAKEPVIAHTGRALIVRQSTALICFRAEAGRSSCPARELDPPPFVQLKCGPRISLIAA